MNLNDFVVLPNNKAKSVKLNARNLQVLQMETVTLAQESKDMEEKLQQLKESMSKEKEERGHSGGFRWKSGQCVSLNSNAVTNTLKKDKENKLQKLSAGKLKIRVLKDEPLTAPPQPAPPPPPPPIGLRTTRKNRLRGTCCGQCEVKTAGLRCAECTEDYCVGCFAKFHQKGALKLHRMIPIQTDLQTHVSTRDVVSRFQKQINPGSHPGTFTSFNPSSKPSPNRTIKSNVITTQEAQSPEKGSKAVAQTMQFHPDPSQVLVVNQETVEMTEEVPKREDAVGFPASLLRGVYNEEESARSFQEALRQWRGEKSGGRREEPRSEEAMWTPVRPVSVSAMATQADLAPNRGAEGRERGGEEGRVPVRVEFTESNLTYMDRLLLKKNRRTPIETYQPSLAFGRDSNLCPNTKTEEAASSLTAQEEDFRRYCASLFAVPVSRGKAEAQITTPESCLTIEYLDESDRDMDGNVVAEQRTANNRKVPSAPKVLSEGRTSVPQMALTSGVSSRISRSSPSLQSRAPAHQPTATQKLHRSKPQTSQAEHSIESSPSKSKPSACPADQTPRTSKTSIKTPTSMSQKPNCFTDVHKSKPDCGSPRLLSSPLLLHSQTEIPKSPHVPLSFLPDVSPLASARPLNPEEHLSPSPSFSLRSTFIVSPSGSTQSALLPKVYQSTPLQKGSDLSLLPEQPQSPRLFPEPISSLKLSQPPPSNLESSRQSQHSLCEPESLLLVNQLQLSLSPVSSSPNTPPKSLDPSPAANSLSSLSLFKSSLDAYSRPSSTPADEDAPLFMSSTPVSGDHESDLSLSCIPSLPSHRLNVIQNPPLAGKMEEEEELSIDSGDEMSSDSLGLASYEEDSSEEEALSGGHLTRERTGEEEPGIPAMPHQEDLQTDEQEQLSEPSVVMHKLGLSAGSGSERSCDLDGVLPLGLDMNSDHSDTPEHTYCDLVHTRKTSPYDSGPTGSVGYWPSSSLGTGTGHLVFGVMEESQTLPTGIQIHSTTPTRRGEISANEPGTSESGSNQSGKSTLVPAACSLSNPRSGSELGPAFRPLSRAAQEIMEICSVDQMGCEDPDLDIDATSRTLHELEQELRLMAKETGKQVSVFGAGSSGSRDQQANHHFTWGRVSEEQKEEEAAAQRDQLSVLLLP